MGERGGRARGVGELVPGAGARAFARAGFAQGALVARWAEIVGPDFARHSSPETLRPAPGGKGGTLTVRVTGAFAPRLAMVEAEVIARVNRFLGRVAVARLALRHADAPPPPSAPPPERADALDPAAVVSLRAVADPALRASLEALARALARTGGPPVFD